MRDHKIITIVFGGDLAHIFYQALSLRKFWKGNLRWTIIVEDKDATLRWCAKHVIPLMEGWNVDIKRIPNIKGSDGWHRQQHLKLISASETKEEWSFILDAKLFLIKPTSFTDYFEDGRMFVNNYSKSKPLAQAHINACKLFNKEPNSVPESFGMVPYIWKTSIVNDLLDFLKGQSDIDVESLDSTEAALYWCFASNKFEWINTRENLLMGQFGGWRNNSRLTPDEFSYQLDIAVKTNLTRFISFHRYHTVPNLVNILNELLVSLEIINKKDIQFFKKTFVECIRFLRPYMQESLRENWGADRMVSIERNGQTISFNRIVAYGCSYTAGSELADHIVTCPNMSMNEIDTLKRSMGMMEWNIKYLPGTDTDGQRTKVEHELAWPNKLAKHFEVPCLNRSRSGSSLQYSQYSIDKDISDGVITDKDLIIVGITSPHRWFYLNENGEPQRPIMGYHWNWPSESFHKEFVLEIYNTYFIAYNFYNSMNYLDMLSDKLNGRILLQPVHNAIDGHLRNFEKELDPDFLKLVTTMRDFKSILDPAYSFSELVDWKNTNDCHGGNHPKEYIHQIFAKHLAEKLSQNGVDIFAT